MKPVDSVAWLPPVDSAPGAIVYGLAAIAIAAVLRFFRAPLIQGARRAIFSLPRPIQRKAAEIGYLVAPSWRSYAQGGARSPHLLEGRLNTLTVGRRARLCLVGGVYADVAFGPVELSPPWGVERATVEEVRVSVGGSCQFLADHLWRGFRMRCRLFSTIGQNDEVTRLLKFRIRQQPYLTHTYLREVAGVRSGVSIHPLSADGAPLPTFTFPGAVEQLRWADILRPLQRSFRRGRGVLYIGSIFRTDLIKDLSKAVSQISPNVLVLVDPGRTNHETDGEKARTLGKVLGEGMADILLVTPSELRSLLLAMGFSLPAGTDAELLEVAALSGCLPRVTVVRGQRSAGYPRAALIFDGRVSLEQGDDSTWSPRNSLGGKQGFNAGFVHELSRPRTNLSLEDKLRAAVRAGLIYWSTVD